MNGTIDCAFVGRLARGPELRKGRQELGCAVGPRRRK